MLEKGWTSGMVAVVAVRVPRMGVRVEAALFR